MQSEYFIPRRLARPRHLAGAVCLASMAWGGAAWAAIYVPDGATISLGGGTSGQNCEAITVHGTLDATGSTINAVGSITVGPTGTILANGATIDVLQSNISVAAGGVFDQSGITFPASPTCGGSNPQPQPGRTTPVPAGSLPGLTLLGLLLGGLPLLRRWRGKRQQAGC